MIIPRKRGVVEGHLAESLKVPPATGVSGARGRGTGRPVVSLTASCEKPPRGDERRGVDNG
jgi:hypothetical protein